LACRNRTWTMSPNHFPLLPPLISVALISAPLRLSRLTLIIQICVYVRGIYIYIYIPTHSRLKFARVWRDQGEIMIIDSVNKNKSTRRARAPLPSKGGGWRFVNLAWGGMRGWQGYNPLVIRRVYRRMTAAF